MTKKQRFAIKGRVESYLTGNGWDAETARLEINQWAFFGMASLTDTPRKAIRKALKQIRQMNAGVTNWDNAGNPVRGMEAGK